MIALKVPFFEVLVSVAFSHIVKLSARTGAQLPRLPFVFNITQHVCYCPRQFSQTTRGVIPAITWLSRLIFASQVRIS